MLTRAPRNATVVAATTTDVLILGARQFDALLAEAPALCRNVLTGVARRLHDADVVLVW